MAYNYVTVSGTFPVLTGNVTFTPPPEVTDTTGTVAVLGPGPYSYPVTGGSFSSAPLLATDNPGLLPAGWTWNVTVALTGSKAYTYPVVVPAAAGSAQTFASLPVSITGTPMVTIDSNASDIQAAPGTASAGSSGMASDAKHIHPSPSVFAPAGLTGATASTRYAGATTSGPPVSGTFATGDFVVDQSGAFWVCVAAGTPGTWTPTGGAPSLASAPAATTTESASPLATALPAYSPGQLFVMWGVSYNGAFTVPSGWTGQLATSGNINSIIATKTAANTDGTAVSVAFAGTGNRAAAIVSTFPACFPDPATLPTPYVNSTGGPYIPVPGITLINTGDRLLWFGGALSAGAAPSAIAPPSGFLGRLSAASGTASTDVSIHMALSSGAVSAGTIDAQVGNAYSVTGQHVTGAVLGLSFA